MRLSTGVPGLDGLLGGGLLPGTLTVAVGATGIGKTQLGLQFVHAGLQQEGRSGILFDMTCRGDAQSHQEYARRMFGWRLSQSEANTLPDLTRLFDSQNEVGDYLRVFDYQGRRVTRRDLGPEAWHDWNAELARKLNVTIAFFYRNFIRGTRRAVIDGVEPAERASDSIQLELFEYIYHQILRKDPEWVARDLLREYYRANAAAAEAAKYDPDQIGCLLLSTSAASMLDELISKPLDEGDLLTNANTVIYLGKIRDGNRLGRGLYVAKHRGSACVDDIVPFRIEDGGLRI